MRIGIDTTALPLNPVGAGTYTINLVRALHALSLEDELVVFATQRGKDQIGVSEKEKFRWVLVPDLKPAFRLLWEQWVFPILAHRNELDLLHSLHYTKPVFLPCASVVTFHDMTFLLYPWLHTHWKRLIFPIFIRLSARQAAALIAISESTRRDSIRLLNLASQKVFSIPLGVSSEFRRIEDADVLDDVRRKYQLPSSFMLYTGLVEPRKNLPMLIRAYAGLVDAGVKEALVIVGRYGWMSTEIFEQVGKLGLGESVVFTGYVEQADLPAIYNLAQIFVYPTLYEGFGLPVLEAMACGTAVVTSAVSSLPEIVADAGVLLPPGDQDALSNALSQLISDPLRRQKLADAGFERAQQFTWRKTALETSKVYQMVGNARS